MYRPPFVSERLGDAGHFVDCTFAAGIMTLASWTLGEAVSNDHVPLDASGLADLRHALRPHGNGGSNPLDVDIAVRKMFPDLPHMPSWDSPQAPLRIDFPAWKKRVQNGECGILQGNAAKVRNAGSALHRFVGDVGHAIYVESSPDPAMAHILDPMGLPLDTYGGDRVSWKDLEEFASAFTTTHVFVSLVVKGEQFSATQVQRKLDQAGVLLKRQTAQIEGLQTTNTTLAASRDAAVAAQKTAEIAQKTAEAGLAAAQVAQKAAEDALAPCQASAADLTTKLTTANETIATQTTSLAALDAKVTELTAAADQWQAAYTDCSTRLDTANAALTACQSGADLAAANATIKELTAQLATANAGLSTFRRMWAFLTAFFRRNPAP